MIKLTEEELNELEAFAGLMFSDAELAEIMEVTEAQLKAEMMKKDSAIRKVIVSARYKIEASLRQAQIQMALRGSTPAGNTCIQFLQKMKS